ncbi:DNA-directed RNA polymerase 3 subunit [Niveomyces insectorum RCEF 264]|uniref:DNA-directed RNA polymerase 3 subunit n=1 Tax=Niveomyces insectorum RCEF 264 TaxID=1081102 RepID=A0A167ZV61_9HYPO|nr:DNA-directed RNA polymerase 3 subunit [Niveomyces insectorum RCEF 264]
MGSVYVAVFLVPVSLASNTERIAEEPELAVGQACRRPGVVAFTAGTMRFGGSPPAAAAAATGRAYGQEQINQRYGVRNKATIDPFTAVPMYSHRFEKPPRALPDLSGRPFSKELFPAELWPTLDETRARAVRDIFATQRPADVDDEAGGDGGDGAVTGTHKALEQLEKFKNVGLDNEDNVEFDLVEDEGDYDEVEDEEYDDDEEGDYNAEAAFDNGDDDDYGDDAAEDGVGGGDEAMY